MKLGGEDVQAKQIKFSAGAKAEALNVAVAFDGVIDVVEVEGIVVLTIEDVAFVVVKVSVLELHEASLLGTRHNSH